MSRFTDDQVTVTIVTSSDAAMVNGFHQQIDQKAGELRELLLSSGSGQAMVYQEKEKEALAIKADSNPEHQDYPLVAVDAELDNVSLSDAADQVLLRASIFRLVGSEIERMRLGAKKQISVGDNPSDCIDLVDGINVQNLASLLQSKGVDLYSLT